jgi:FKBP-type peptidyl-prolyl cis-trans isomerase FkpA
MKRHLVWVVAVLVVAGLVVAIGMLGEEKGKGKQMSVEYAPGRTAVLTYEDLVEGTGKEAHAGDEVEVHYTGWLTDGRKFDSSHDRGEPYPVRLGAGNVIKGWDAGLVGMKVGGKRKLTIPPELGYGSRGHGSDIPPGATLVFDVELVNVR